jgi:hypothetical protein
VVGKKVGQPRIPSVVDGTHRSGYCVVALARPDQCNDPKVGALEVRVAGTMRPHQDSAIPFKLSQCVLYMPVCL